MAKISIIGAGFVGSTTAHWLATRGISEIILFDRNEGTAKGKALDLLQAMPIIPSSAKFFGTSDYQDTKNSDIVVITAGFPRKPGMSRDQLLEANATIVKEVSANVAKYSPNSILIVVTNPLDAMVYAAWKVTQFPTKRILGMAGILDTARMQTFIAQALNVSAAEVSALVLGGHGDSMVPLMRYAILNDVSVTQLLPKETLNAIIERTRNGGAEIVQLLQTGSAYYAPAAAVMQMTEAILKDQKRMLPCAAYLNGEYGVKGLFVGVPVILGQEGAEKIVELELDAAEKEAFQNTVKHVQELCTSTDRYL